MTISNHVNQTTFIRRLLRPCCHHLTQVRNCNNRIKRFITRSRNVIQRLSRGLSPTFHTLRQLSRVNLFIHSKGRNFRFQRILPIFQVIRSGLNHTISSSKILSAKQRIFRGRSILYNRHSTSLLFARNAMRMNSRISRFLILRRIRHFISSRFFNGSLTFLSFVRSRLRNSSNGRQGMLFLENVFRVRNCRPIVRSVRILNNIRRR